MKVTINTHGHSVEIETTDPDMTVHRLANIAVNTWRRTVNTAHDRPGPASAGPQIEQGLRHSPGIWGASFGFGEPPLEIR